MSENLPPDLQGLPVTYQGKERGVVTRDLGGERVKVRFEDGSEEYVPRTDLEVVDDNE